MDALYVGDIPKDYTFAVYSNYYIDLYNTSTLNPNRSYTYYRVFLYDNNFSYQVMSTTTGNSYRYLTGSTVETTDSVWYRRDLDSILTCTFIIAFFGVLLVNLITSVIKRGGILGGLF